MDPNNTTPPNPAGGTPPSAPAPTPPAAGGPAFGSPAPVPPAGPPVPVAGQVITGGFDAGPSTAPAGAPGPAPIPGAAPAGPPSPAAPASLPPRRRPWKALLIALIVVIILGGGAAAAYVGIVVPNKPANVLKQALINSVQETQSSTSGSFTTKDGTAKVAFSSAENATAKTVDLKADLIASGVSFPVEGRLVNQNFYVKVGDLSTITDLLNAYSPSFGSLAQTLSSQLSNKWIVFDSTLIDQDAGLKCLLNTNWTLSKADVNTVESQYDKHPFATIQSSSNVTLNGQPAEKFVLSVSNSALNSFGNGLDNLSLVKNIAKCPGFSDLTSDASSAGHGQTPLTVWVDKSDKRIVQVMNQSSAGTVTVKLQYGPVTVTAPSGAEPAMQVLSNLEQSLGGSGADLSQLLGSGTSSSSDTFSD